MEIRMLQKEEIKIASGLSRYVFDYSLRNRMEYPQTIAYVEEYIAEYHLQTAFDACEIILWGAFENYQMVGVSAMQRDGLITMLYVLPQCQNKGYGSKLLREMRNYAKESCNFSKVSVNATPAWTSFYFTKRGFLNVNPAQDIKAPFVPMYSSSDCIDGYVKRPVSKGVIIGTVVGCFLFATIVASLFMIWYLTK